MIDDLCRCGRRLGGGATSLTTTNSRPGRPESSIPFGIAAELHRLPERDHLYCRWHEPQLDPLRHQHLEQWLDMVTPESTRERSGSHRDLLLRFRRLRGRGQHRQHRGRVHHHGDDHRRPLVDVAIPATGYESVELGFVPEHCRLLRGGGDSVLASVNAGYAWSAQSIPSDVAGLNAISCATTSDCTAVGFGIFGSPVIIGTVDAGATWTSEPVPSGVGILTGVSCASTFVCQAVSDFGSSAPSIIATSNGGAIMDDGTVSRDRDQLHGHLLPGSPALHRCRGLVRRPRRRHPRHGERRIHLAPANASRRCDRPQWHLVLQRHDVPGDRIPRRRHDRRWIHLERPGNPGRIDRPGIRQLHQHVGMHCSRRRRHPHDDGRRHRWTSEQAPSGVASLFGVAAPVRSTVKPSGRTRTPVAPSPRCRLHRTSRPPASPSEPSACPTRPRSPPAVGWPRIRGP